MLVKLSAPKCAKYVPNHSISNRYFCNERGNVTVYGSGNRKVEPLSRRIKDEVHEKKEDFQDKMTDYVAKMRANMQQFQRRDEHPFSILHPKSKAREEQKEPEVSYDISAEPSDQGFAAKKMSQAEQLVC
jgi:hypothetical protein